METIAFLGIGAMGDRLATRLLEAGYPLRVWNRTAERCQSLVQRGAIACATPMEAAQGADVAIAMVSDDQASQQVWLAEATGAIHGLRAGAIAMEYSTLTPDYCRTLATQFKPQSIQFLDAPVVGSRPQAEAGKLIHLVGGEKSVLEQVHPILTAGSGAIHHVGAVGMGMTVKLMVNALFGAQVAVLGEVLGVLRRAGLPPQAAVKLLNQMPTTSPALQGIGTLIANENYAPLFPITLVEKDFSYVEQVANSCQAAIPALRLVRERYRAAQAEGYGEDNIAGIAQLYL